MNRVIYTFLSLVIFVIIAPLFHAFFANILLSSFQRGYLYIDLNGFIFTIYIAYIIAFIPALVSGLLYGLLSPSRHKTKLIWLIPMLSCLIYLVYAFIFEMVTHLLGREFIYFALVFSLLSIGGTFVATLVANVMLKRDAL